MPPADTTPDAAKALPGIPLDDHGPVFREPWEARAFAIAVALHDGGLFTWSDWAAILGEEIERAQRASDPGAGQTYYHHWLAALERMVAERGLATPQILQRYVEAWDHAAGRTPHGAPIELTDDDFAGE
jgi:nitrile hydratase accessory protein